MAVLRVGIGGWHMIDEVDLISLVAGHARLARLCDALEIVADRLPVMPGEAEALRLREDLGHVLPTHEARECAVLAALFGGHPPAGQNRAIMQHIGNCRASCLVQGQDLVAALSDETPAPCTETLGYMLRSFFQTCRQAMAFEALAILHMGDRRLTSDAAALMRASLEARCGG
ncbi:hypothetical protein [Sphingomonas oryzagri]